MNRGIASEFVWEGKSVSVILMTYRERDSIRRVVNDFWATGLVDEVVVVNNNAEPGTTDAIAGTGAREVLEGRQGYGYATQRGLRESTGDLVIIAEPDATFSANDIRKLLVYSGECDVVFGTRTTKEFIWHGANMGFVLRWGNWAVAKLIEVLFNTSHLSDVGCSYRLLTRESIEKIQDRFSTGGSHFGPELMLLVITSGLRFVEVPVSYMPRVGQSAVTGHRPTAIRLGFRMVALVASWRIRTLGRATRPTRRTLAE